jgi:Villin headpiece domain
LLGDDVILVDTVEGMIVWVGQAVAAYDRDLSVEYAVRLNKELSMADDRDPDDCIIRMDGGGERLLFTRYFPDWNENVVKPTVEIDRSYLTEVRFAEHKGLPKSDEPPKEETQSGTQQAQQMQDIVNGLDDDGAARKLQQEQQAALVAQQLAQLEETSAEPSNPADSADADHVAIEQQEASAPATVKMPAASAAPQESYDALFANLSSAPPTSTAQPSQEKKSQRDPSVQIFSMTELRTMKEGINLQAKETYLDDREFNLAFGMERNQFYALPAWKQGAKKKEMGLF